MAGSVNSRRFYRLDTSAAVRVTELDVSCLAVTDTIISTHAHTAEGWPRCVGLGVWQGRNIGGGVFRVFEPHRKFQAEFDKHH